MGSSNCWWLTCHGVSKSQGRPFTPSATPVEPGLPTQSIEGPTQNIEGGTTTAVPSPSWHARQGWEVGGIGPAVILLSQW